MRTILSFSLGGLSGIAPLFVAVGLSAAPVAWFPGPSVDPPFSGAATVFSSDRGNILIGGDAYVSYYYPLTQPESLAATNVSWNFLTPSIQTLQIGAGAVLSGGMIIIYGGSDGTQSVSTVIGYNFGDGSTALASMSVPRSYIGYAPDSSGNAYAIGGLDANGQALSSAERFNPESGANGVWSGIASMPTPLYSFPAVFDHTNRIYVFGGRTNSAAGTETTCVLRYSTAANNWTTMASMPIAVAGSAATWGPDGKIYVVGGVSGGVATSVVQVYNPAANSWAISTPLPEPLSGSAMGVDSLGRLIVMGGTDTNGDDIGDVWRSQQFGLPDLAPTFTQYPGTIGGYLISYTSSINATGNPPATYVPLVVPDRMQVDPYTGAITWTPQADQIGINYVSIRATNYVGFADWDFVITVTNPPPTVPAHFAVSNVNDNSATLSWDPESPVVGSVTYTVSKAVPYHSPRGSGGGINYYPVVSGLTATIMTLSLAPDSSQNYAVRATGASGTSAYSSMVVVKTTAPQGPTSLYLSGLTSTTVNLSWSPSLGPADNPLFSPIVSYTIVERKSSVDIPTVTNIVGTNGIITGLTPGLSHLWYVSGVDAQGYGSPLGAVYLVVANPVPAPATVSGGTVASDSSFQFTASEGGSVLQTILIQATTNPADPNSWVQIGSLLPESNPFSFADTNASLYPARFYRILAP